MPTMQLDVNTEARIAEAAARGAAQSALGVGEAHAKWLEALRQAGIEPIPGRRIGVRPVIQQLAVSLGVGVGLVSSDVKSWSVPAQELLIVEEIRGLFAFEDVLNEPVTLGNLTPLTPQGVAFIKAGNCKVNLVRGDTQIAITTPEDVNLATLVPELGGKPLPVAEGAPSYIIPGGQMITARLAMTNVDASLGKKCRYGLVLVGTLLRP